MVSASGRIPDRLPHRRRRKDRQGHQRSASKRRIPNLTPAPQALGKVGTAKAAVVAKNTPGDRLARSHNPAPRLPSPVTVAGSEPVGANGSDWLCYAVFEAPAVPVRSQIKGRPRRPEPVWLAALGRGTADGRSGHHGAVQHLKNIRGVLDGHDARLPHITPIGKSVKDRRTLRGRRPMASNRGASTLVCSKKSEYSYAAG
jgi:hypothetical protein